MNSAIFQLYGITLIASVFLAGGLALLGTQLAAKDRAMQTLCMGQGAMLGVLLGLGLSQTLFSSEHSETYLPLIFAVLSAALSFVISEFLVAKKLASSNTHFASFFAALLSGGYLISSLFPALENHMAQKYFGDLATLGANESKIGLAIGILLIGIFVFFGRRFSEHSFEVMISGKTRRTFSWPHPLDLLSIVAICTCVQTVGYLFTIACLFIPTAFASRTMKAGLRKHLAFCIVLAMIATASGFTASLIHSTLPTVPTIIACMVSLGLIASLIGKRIVRA